MDFSLFVLEVRYFFLKSIFNVCLYFLLKEISLSSFELPHKLPNDLRSRILEN